MLHHSSLLQKRELDALLGIHPLCESLSCQSEACTFSHIKGDYLSPKWIQAALNFKISELTVGCHLSTAEVFMRKKCELERYECGNQVITLPFSCRSEGFGSFLPVALGLLGVAIKPKCSQGSIILKHNFHDWKCHLGFYMTF